LGDGTQVYTDAPQHIYSDAGTYTVSLEAANEYCSDQHIQDIEVELGSVGLSENSDLNFWIARNAETLSVHFNGVNGLLNLEVHDMSGRLVLSEQIQGESSVYNLNTANFSQGIYSLRMMTESEVLFQTNFNK
jgi:PKD repeat protein